MKKTLFVAFLACITMMFVSCKKEKTLNGTTWKAQIVTTEDMGEDQMEATLTTTLDFTLKFIDASKASMTMTSSATATMGGPFDGEKGTLTGVDEETGKPETIPFTYNKKDNTIKMSETQVDDDGEPITIELVFNEVK